MIKKLKLFLRLGELYLKGKVVKKECIGDSYTKISQHYENCFLKTMHTYNDLVLTEIIKEGSDEKQKILDLACGTGYNSAYLKEHYKKASYYLVDISKGMLEQAKQKELEDATYIQQDMLGFLKSQKSESFDKVICFWAIKYQPPEKIVKEVYRVLKPGGVFGVIVNTKRTLPEIRSIYPKLLMAKSHTINQIMYELPNPPHKKAFDKWFKKSGLILMRGSEGKHTFSFGSEKELARWVTHTGALAGFDVMINLKNKNVQNEMCNLLRKEGIKQVTHTFVWGIFKK